MTSFEQQVAEALRAVAHEVDCASLVPLPIEAIVALSGKVDTAPLYYACTCEHLAPRVAAAVYAAVQAAGRTTFTAIRERGAPDHAMGDAIVGAAQTAALAALRGPHG